MRTPKPIAVQNQSFDDRMLSNLIATYKLSGSRDAVAKCIVRAGVVLPACSGELHTKIYGHILNAEPMPLPGHVFCPRKDEM